jgi:glycosyltransferase involved in cell wall biosynthesis
VATIDVLIPAYNAAATLREAIGSLQAQTFSDIRIVIVDDGSTDATPEILADLAKQDERILVLRKPNGGIVEALNYGLRLCDSEFLARFDADDFCFPGRLEIQLAWLRQHPACVAVGCAVEHMDEHGRSLSSLPQPGSPAKADAFSAPAREPYIVHPFLMARRVIVAGVGGYRHVPLSEDSDLYWRLQEKGELVNLPDVLGRYRVHTASLSSSIVNGRVMAAASQLGALSARRRRAGKPDIEFEKGLHGKLKAAETLKAMCAIIERGLDADEAEYLRIAAAAKLMELAGYRPYELDASDCAFVRAALPLARRLPVANQKAVMWHVTTTAARLIRKGRLAEAFALTPPKAYPKTAARVLVK